MKIFAIDLFRYNEKIESIVYACAAYDEVISVPEESGAVAVVLGRTESDAIRKILNVTIQRCDSDSATWKAKEFSWLWQCLWQQPLLALQEMRLSITEKNRQAM